MILNPFTAPVHTKLINVDNSFVSNIFDKMLLTNGDSWSQLSLIFLKSSDEEEEEENSIKQSFDANLILNLLLKLNSIKNSGGNRNYIYLEKNIDIIIKNYLKRVELSDKKNYYELKRIIKEIKNDNTYKNLEYNAKNGYNENLVKIYKIYEKINNNELKNISNNNRYNNKDIDNIINEKKNIEEVSQLLIENSNLIIENKIESERKNLNNINRLGIEKKLINSKASIILGLKHSNTSMVKRSIENNTLFHKIVLNKANNEIFKDINSKIILKNIDIKKENNYIKNLLIDIDNYRKNLIENINELQFVNQSYNNDENKIIIKLKRVEKQFKELLTYGIENSQSTLQEKMSRNDIINSFNNWININNNNNERRYNLNFLIDRIQQLKINNKENVINQLLEIEELNKYIGNISSFSSFKLINDFNIIKQIYAKEKKLIELSFKEDIIKNQILNNKVDKNFINSQIISIKKQFNKEILLQERNRLQFSAGSNIIIKNAGIHYDNSYVNLNETDVDNYNRYNYQMKKYRTEDKKIDIGEKIVNKLSLAIKNQVFNFNGAGIRTSTSIIIDNKSSISSKIIDENININGSIKNNFNSNFNYLLDSRTIYKKTNKTEDNILNNQIMLNINKYEKTLINDIKELKILKRQNNVTIKKNQINSIENSNTQQYYKNEIAVKNKLEKLQNIIEESYLEQNILNQNSIIRIHEESKINILKKSNIGLSNINKYFKIDIEKISKTESLKKIHSRNISTSTGVIEKIVLRNLQIQQSAQKNLYKYEGAKMILKNFNIIKENDLEQLLLNIIYDNKKSMLDSYSQHLNTNLTNGDKNSITIKGQEDKSIRTDNLSVRISNSILNLIKRNSITNNDMVNNLEEYKRTILNNKNIENYKLNLNKNFLDYKINSFLSKKERKREQYYNSIKNNAIKSSKPNIIDKNSYDKYFLLNLSNYENDIVFNNTIKNISHVIFNKKIKAKLNLSQNSATKEHLIVKNLYEGLHINKALREDNMNVFYNPELLEINSIFNLNKQRSVKINNYLQKYKLRQASNLNLALISGNTFISKSLSTLIDLNKFNKKYNKNYNSVINNNNNRHKEVMLLSKNNDFENSSNKDYLSDNNKYKQINLESKVKEFDDVNFNYRKNTIVNEQEKNVEDNSRKNDIITEQQISKIINETVEKIVEKKLSENKDSNISEEEKVNNLSKKVIANIEKNLNYEKRRRGLI